jgi:hypothetical protein
MSTVTPTPLTETAPVPQRVREITVYSHSALVYWWPVWLVGFVLAAVTYVEGQAVNLGDTAVIMHPSKNLGVIYTLVTFLVILLTNATVRGLASALVIVIILALTFALAYYDLWEDIFRMIRSLAIYMNLGFYVLFSTAIFGIWLAAVFLFDRLEYWTFRPGQVIQHTVFGGGARTYDTHGMSVFKLRDDLFRHWILGLGSGDIHIATTGAQTREFVVPNVMFIGWKLAHIERLIAMSPDETGPTAAVTVGGPG